MTFRSILYKLGRILGDLNAISKGKVGQRMARRGIGKLIGRWLQRIFR